MTSKKCEALAGFRGALAIAIGFACATSLFGQAWTPPAGQGTIWFTGQTLHTDAHTIADGSRRYNVDVRANTATLGIDYGLTDRLALAISLPYVSSRLKSGAPHPGTIIDDGATHGAVTDLTMEVRYKLVDSAVVITPLLAVSLPTRDYPTLGHAAQGRGLDEYSAGFDFGHNAIAISPYLFVSGRYVFTYVERVDPDVTVDRSNADFHVMVLATSRLTARASTMWQNTHGGLNLPLVGDEALEHFHHHDQLARANHWRAGLGLSFALTPKLEMFGAWSTVLEAENSHAFRSWTAGIAWNFDGTRFRRARPLVE